MVCCAKCNQNYGNTAVVGTAVQHFGDNIYQAVSYQFSKLGLEYSVNCDFIVLLHGCNTSSLTHQRIKIEV